ncbi:hypothetical protein BSL82_13995 [Tardibacter chloracetimidivorans]|uniref:Major facilitator superfamily (MFS) profile domain-containing protein n=1 Tax=Tardibacter chloracetimidivorans TaxID=1921510 RepID=A0A1L3ZXA6_9SPHN|nr:MFS transporter [Tardibacter chloracetimidivorans]API60263.1 hypothetical protein BSL82_13995 [Tardibacter chloracetimidivorans]
MGRGTDLNNGDCIGTRDGLAKSSRCAVASLAATIFLSSLGGSVSNVGLPTLSRAFAIGFSQAQWIVLAYFLAVISLIVNAGGLADSLGRQRLLLGGLLLFGLGSIGAGAAWSFWLLIVARGLQGVGGAIMLVLATALVCDIVPTRRLGSVLGLLAAMSGLGTAAGPSLGGFLIAGFGWRALFFVNVPICIAIAWMVHRTVPRTRHATAGPWRPDWTGTFLLVGALCAYCYAATPESGRFAAGNLVALALAVAGAAVFVLVERRAANPLLRLEMFRDPSLCGNLGMSVIGSTVIMATLVVGPFYLIDGLQMTPAQAGLALSVGPVISAVGGVPIGRLVDRLGIVAMSLAGLAIMAAGAAGLAFSEGIVGLPRFIGSLIVVMGGYGVFQISNNAAVMAKSSSATRGTFAGLMNLSRNIGLVTGASVMASIFSATAHGTNGELPIVLDAAHGLKTTFAVAAGLATLAVAIGLSSGAIPLFRRCANRGG